MKSELPSYEFQSLIDLVVNRLDGHGVEIKCMSSQISSFRIEFLEKLKNVELGVKNVELGAVKDTAHIGLKVATVSGIISTIMIIATAFLTAFFKHSFP